MSRTLPARVIIGLDPGNSSGAIAALAVDRSQPPDTIKLSETERDVWDWLQEHAPRANHAYLELVHAMPKQGVSSSFKFGRSYGMLRGMLIASGIPSETVTPQKWQSALSCRSAGDKRVTKAKAQELFPFMRITHAIADALLIAEYGRRRLDPLTNEKHALKW